MPTEVSSDRSVRLSRLDSVEFARGLAALAVCVFHFTKYLWPDDSVIRKAGSFGWAGVESFFVISGFIIPYAMERSGYAVYLVHVPVGGRIVNLGNRFAGEEWSRWVVFSMAVASSFGAAWILFIKVERPALAWSSRIKYSTSKGVVSGITTLTAQR